MRKTTAATKAYYIINDAATSWVKFLKLLKTLDIIKDDLMYDIYHKINIDLIIYALYTRGRIE